MFNINKQKHIMNTLEINWKDGTTTKSVNDKVVTQETNRTTEDILKSLITSYNCNEKPNYVDLRDLESIVKIDNPNFKY